MNKWVEGRWSWDRTLMGGMRLSVIWESTPESHYAARVDGRRLTKHFQDVESAKKAAESLARSLLERSLDDLNGE